LNQITKKHVRQVGSRTAVASAVLMLGTAGAAWAQDASQTVTVTGIRRGIENAINVKKNADGVVESISAEDIGKLPDTTVAETISRMPGLTTQRSKATGRAQSVSVRGLAPDFATGTLNGREQASTSDSRSVDFDQFPAELLGGITVYKSPDAGQINQGLAGTIDLQTVRPLNFGKRTIAVNYRKQETGKGLPTEAGKGDRAALSYVDQFADRTIGVALGFTRFKDEGAGQLKFNSWGGWAPELSYNGANVKTPGGFTADTEQTTTKRDGAMAVLQYKPNKNFESVLDVFWTKGNFKTSKKGLEGAIGGQSAGGYDPSGALINATIVGGVAESGTITNYKGVVRNHDEATEDKLTSIGWNNKLKFGEWTGVADLSQSKVTKHSSRYETTAGQPGNANNAPYAGNLGTISWSGFNGGNFEAVKYSTSLDYSNPAVAKLTDVMGWSGGENSPQAGYVALPTTTDKINALRLSGKRSISFGDLTDIELGANFTERTKTHTANEGRLVIKDSVNMTTGATISPYAFKEVPGAGVGIAGTTGLKVISWNPTGSLGTIYDLPPKVDKDILNKSWDVQEKVTTLYMRSGIETKFAGLWDARGNVGLQVVKTDQTGAGYFVNQSTCTGNTPATCPSTRVDAGDTYYDVMPSLNLAIDAGGDSVVRLGIGRTLSRPSMADMRGSLTFSLNSTAQGGPRYEGSSGNPFLKPFRANVVDVSYEKYFGGTKGYVALAGFYKDLASYVFQQSTAVDFSKYGVTLPAGVSPVGVFTAPANGTGGSVQGLEFALSVPLGLVFEPLDGFGIQFNHTYTDSSVSIPAIGLNTNDVNVANLPLPGLSRNSTNIRVYYEKYGFQIAVAQRQQMLGRLQRTGAVVNRNRMKRVRAAFRVIVNQNQWHAGRGGRRRNAA